MLNISGAVFGVQHSFDVAEQHEKFYFLVLYCVRVETASEQESGAPCTASCDPRGILQLLSMFSSLLPTGENICSLTVIFSRMRVFFFNPIKN